MRLETIIKYGIILNIPISTYRLQFNKNFRFKNATSLVDYFSRLGADHIYASPLLGARPGTNHGYDVTDQSVLNSELGSEQEFKQFSAKLKSRGMGLIMDVVPNHMCITDSSNKFWMDVLENGPSSIYARFFDINWHPHKTFLSNKVLLPFLGDQYGKILENKEMQVSYESGAFFVHYYGLKLPVAPRTSVLILEDTFEDLSSIRTNKLAVDELRSIISGLNNLPLRTETVSERIRERHQKKGILKKQLDELTSKNKIVLTAIKTALTQINGKKGIPRSFDKLEQLLDDQAYRLAYWRVAADEINYRRFFDINELAAIRVEEPDVFKAVHELVIQFIKKGYVSGLRVDHVDGLFDPKKYLEDLQQACQNVRSGAAGKPFYVVVEKILENSEQLRSDWPVAGTTGYDFLNLLNGLFVNPAHKSSFLKLYRRFTGQKKNFFDLLCQCKEMITHVSNASELYVLASKLEKISKQHRWSRDFTFDGLRYALREIIACFPVYRSYIQLTDEKISPEDKQLIQGAIKVAIKRNPTTNVSLFEFVGQVLLREDPEGLSESNRNERRNFTMKFQQLTSPIMAKGLEDTSFYQYYPLASLNEVGGHPDKFGVTVGEFHKKNIERLKKWPGTLLATTTHDTKRSEDVRARLNVLSEIPAPWYRTVCRWAGWNKDIKREVDGERVPDANEEYLLYQTIVGTWPILPLNNASLKGYVIRIEEYMIKALREAKLHTSWINPNKDYEDGVRYFVQSVLSPGPKNRFMKDVKKSVLTIIKAGRLNSLSQVFLKITSPGVPDFYQGTELLNFSLVDPDNRRPVPFPDLKSALKSAERVTWGQSKKWIRHLMKRPVKGRIKLFVMQRSLQFRKKNPDLFLTGDYIPLTARGPKKNHIVSFVRSHNQKSIIAVAARFFMSIDDGDGRSFQSGKLKNTFLSVPKKFSKNSYRDVLTGNIIKPLKQKGSFVIRLSDVMTHLPVALLEKV